MRYAIPLALLFTGCVEKVSQVAGVGANYTTRCSARMTPKELEFETQCEPAPCDPTFRSVAVNHVVVAIVPNTEVIGYAERVCIQDLSKASQLFAPQLNGEPVATPAETPAAAPVAKPAATE
jgi:hypothetical protein